MSKFALKVHDGLLICGSIVFVALVIVQSLKSNINADDFMVVNKIYIPDFEVGEDPVMLYDREVFQPFSAHWLVDIYYIPEEKHVCYGEGFGEYRAATDVSKYTVSDYVGKACSYKPGEYIARTRWEATDGFVIRNTSNLFRVFPKGGRPHRPRKSEG